jgi:hypothetical protein
MGRFNTDSGTGENPDVIKTVGPSFALGCCLLIVCYFTLTFPGNQWARLVRFLLCPFAFWAFMDFGFGHFLHYDLSVNITVCETPV